MSAFSQAQAQNVLNGTLGTSAFVATTAPLNLRVTTTAPSESATGTELGAGGSYVAAGAAVTFSAATVQTGTYSAQALNNAWSQANMPACSAVGLNLTDSAGTPARKMWATNTTTRAVNAGDTLSYPAGSLVASA